MTSADNRAVQPGLPTSQEGVDVDDDPPFICPLTGVACIRAFCEDYGCADKARVPLDANDAACGSIFVSDEIVPRIPATRRKRGFQTSRE